MIRIFFASLLLGSGVSIAAQSAVSETCLIIQPDGNDGLVASPKNYRMLCETDDVRVLEMTVAPHTRETMHSHARPAVMYLDQPSANKTYFGSSAQAYESTYDSADRPIATWVAPEGLHAMENTGETTFHAIRVEFKHPGCALPGVTTVTDPGPQDGVRVWPQGHHVMFENSDVRVLDVHNAPHSKEPFHTHVWPAFFYVVQAVPMKYSTQDGAAPVMLGVPPIKVIPLAPNPMHSVENLGDRDAHFVRFELKLAAAPKATR